MIHHCSTLRFLQTPITSRVPVTLVLFLLLVSSAARLEAAEVEIELTIAVGEVNLTGKRVDAMTINGSIPGPVLRFNEGDTAVIHVRNEMPEDTSIHWHGILVPPLMDGVPFISFPPIASGATFTYRFPIRQSGTYWYHSHTRLQEQRGVYGAIVIAPAGSPIDVREDHVVLLSDWSDEDPHEILRTLRRGSEWYEIEKGSAQSIVGAVRVGKLKEYFQRELMRMPAMDISDVAYDLFLANGAPEISIAADRQVRLRLINGSASSYFHLEYAGGPITIVSADGQDVVPFELDRLLIGVAETYDVTLSVPPDGSWELRASSHDGSGYSSTWIGEGRRHPAPVTPKPDLYAGMGQPSLHSIFALTPAASMGMPDDLVEQGAFDAPGMHGMGGMHDMNGMNGMHDMNGHDGHEMGEGGRGADQESMERMGSTGSHEHSAHGGPDSTPATPAGEHDQHAAHDMTKEHHEPSSAHGSSTMDHGHHHGEEDKTGSGPDHHDSSEMPPRGGKPFGKSFGLMVSDVSSRTDIAVDGTPSRPFAPYEQLRSTRVTGFDSGKPHRDIRLTLDGDMERFVWFLNDKPLSESDSILIREGEIVRFIMINRTMMHHPMHLHGHFFRVINGAGDRSPLKHTVDVAPMTTTVVEFEANEKGDWFFHCHLLYHMESGMARLVHYDGYQISPQLAAIRPKLFEEHWVSFAEVDAMSNSTAGFVTSSTTRNIIAAEWEAGWEDVDETEGEVTLTWDRYVNRFFTFFGGINAGNAIERDRAIVGIRYLLPFNIESMLFAGSDGEGRIALGREFHITPRISFGVESEYDTAQGWEHEAGLSYLISRRLSARAHWQSEYGAGAGLGIRF